MARITIDIDAPILRELKRLQKREHRSLGKLFSQLLAEALLRGQVTCFIIYPPMRFSKLRKNGVKPIV